MGDRSVPRGKQQEQISVFVRATMPGTLWIGEVDLQIGGYRKLFVFGHLQSASGEGWPEVYRYADSSLGLKK